MTPTTRRYPRTLEEAFGPNPWPITRYGGCRARSSLRSMLRWSVAVCAAALFVAAAMVA